MYVTVITIIIVISLYNTLFKYFIQYICGKVVNRSFIKLKRYNLLYTKQS